MRLLFFLSLLFFASCSLNQNKEEKTAGGKWISKVIYSKNSTDSFYISISLPPGYSEGSVKKYPVVYLLDANLYFDIIATTINKYAEVGLSPKVILAGIGYKDIMAMDSLRNRDYTHPEAIPEYEMSTSGGAENFLSFIDDELMPFIDNTYASDTNKRVLMGHSLGGYFSSYALTQHLLGKSNKINYYVAASPSLHYNHYYLLDQLEKATAPPYPPQPIKAYFTYGGLEDSEETGDADMRKTRDIMEQLSKFLSHIIVIKSDIYSSLDHMDTSIPSFIKGLQWMLSEQQ